MTRLGELIEAASRANHGRSMQDAADLATSLGAPISKSHISKNARKVQHITPAIIKGIAAGYGVPEEDVARAVLADFGVTLNDYSPTPESAVRRDPDLSSEARAMLLAAIEAARTSPGRVTRVDEPKKGSMLDMLGADKRTGASGDEDRNQRHQLGGS